jgi:uncharacterized short protein YbdD (DUF466 family)
MNEDNEFEKRLFKIAKELDVSTDQIERYLKKHGYKDALRGRGFKASIVEEEAYLVLLKEYADDEEAAQRLEQLTENQAEQTKTTDTSESTEDREKSTGKPDSESSLPASSSQPESTSSSNGEVLTVEQALQLDEEERLSYLLEQWELDEPRLRGRLKQFGPSDMGLWKLVDAQTPAGDEVNYPLKNLERGSSRRIFAGVNLSYDDGELVEAEFKLSDQKERKKHKNPLFIRLIEGSISRMREVPQSFVELQEDGTLHVGETLYQNYVESQRQRLPEEIREKEKELKEAREKAQEAREKVQEIKDEAENAKEKQEAARERAEELEQKAAELEDKKGDLYRELNETEQEVESKIKSLKREAKEQKAQIMNDVRKLRDYVTQRADQLHRLDLISDKQRGNLVGESSSETFSEEALSFSDDLDGDFERLVDHMQAYLLDDGILYPRFLLEDFLTLLRTHDLVVLSGLSGSGKTQLVHSFADAVGGVAHVIPVKPNWTSSEDLLGYYNPLQKSYLTTPFLDALIEAKRDPERLHLICLDEMNLSRVEHYFADFLSKLEERKETPELPLYSTEEAGHVEAEVRALMGVIDEAEDQKSGEVYDNFGELLQDEEISEVLQKRLGIENGKSFVELHAHLRRMLAGVLNIPAKLSLPENVRFIGAINMDQTTNTLAPKVLDRAHIMRFESPMTYDWELIQNQSEATGAEAAPVHLPARQFTPPRKPYPEYSPDADDLADQLVEWTEEYLRPIGIDIGLRTVRQALNYRDLLQEVHAEEEDALQTRALNSILLRKVLPRFSFEGNRPVSDPEKPDTRHGVVKEFRDAVRDELNDLEEEDAMPNAARELDRLIEKAEQSGATIYNYWS